MVPALEIIFSNIVILVILLLQLAATVIADTLTISPLPIV